MKEYVVKWRIEVDGKNYKDAAREALRMLRDPDTTALFFEVEDMDLHRIHMVNLYEEN